MIEWLDLYTKGGELLGKTHRRGDPLAAEEYIYGTAVWVLTSQQELLVTLRAPEKKSYPNTWENPGGAVLAGESTRQAVARELSEETGILAPPDAFDYLCHSLNGRLHFDSYGLRKDIEISQVVLEAKETASARLVNLTEWKAMVKENQFAAPITQEILTHWDIYWEYFTNGFLRKDI